MDPLHPRHQFPRDPVRFGVGHGFHTGEGALHGVTKVIKRLFAPQYHPRYATHGPASHVVARARAAGRSPLAGAGRAGMKRGKRVDRELVRVVRLLSHARLTAAAYLAPEPLSATATTAAAVRALEALRTDAHPFVAHILRVLTQRLEPPLFPIDGQVAVGQFRVLRLGTAVDLVCLDRDGGVWIVEIKTGYLENYHQYVARMKPPFEAFPDSPFYQHQIQLMLTCDLYERTFQTRVAGACVVRIDEFHVHRHELQPAVAALRDRCLAVVAADARGARRTVDGVRTARRTVRGRRRGRGGRQ